MAKLRHERICQLNSNHKYSYCPYCSEYANLPAWMIGFCSENCRNIYNIVSDYKIGYLSASEALAKLSECDLSEKDQFESYMREPLEMILNSATATDSQNEETDAPVNEEVVEEKEEENLVFDEPKKHNNRYRYNKKN